MEQDTTNSTQRLPSGSRYDEPPQVAANRQNAAVHRPEDEPGGPLLEERRQAWLRSELPVLPGERAEDWQQHHDGIAHDLAPVGTLEQALASRVALCLGRMQRVAAYETTVTAAGLEEVDERAEGGASRRQLTLLGETDAGRLEKVLEDLRQKQSTVDAWEGAFRLLERLPDLPDDTPVTGRRRRGLQTSTGRAKRRERVLRPEDQLLAGLGVPRDELDNAWAGTAYLAGMVRR
jgi:hypothetical protein